MNAEIIAVGSELLTPYRSDTNSLFITGQLNRIGVDVALKSVVGDDRQRLSSAIALAWERSDLVILIGGLGPTEDDLTRDAAAAALGRSQHRDERIVDAITNRFRARGLRMPEINFRQAMVIDGAEVIENVKGTAPGLWFEEQGRILILLPGPPRELLPMFEHLCIPRLKKTVPPAAIRTRVLRMTGITESAVDELTAPIYTRYKNPVTTILSTLGEIQLHLKSFGKDEKEAQSLLDELSPQIESVLGKHLFSTTGESLEEVVGRLLLSRGETVSVAESCTGGLIAQRITSVPGSSAYFWGGLVCYSNQSKTAWAGVAPSIVEAHGAVSSQVAQALAEGVRSRTGTTYGLGVTGVAGPDGGTADKPVGLVYFALASPVAAQSMERRLPGDRETIRWHASQTSLDMLRRALEPGRK